MSIGESRQRYRQWENDARCQRTSPALFFPPTNFEPSKLRRKRETKAKTMCEYCPVKDECLQYALKHDYLEGVWGGTNLKERRQIKFLKQITDSK